MADLYSFDRVPELETPRLVLREIDPIRDLDAVYELFADERVALNTDTGPFSDRSEAEEVVNWFGAIFRNGHGLRWAITEANSPNRDLIGTCGVNIWDRRNSSAEIGYDLMPDYWGRGIATEAVGAMVDWCFENLGLNRIQADVMVDNAASARVLRKLGFVEEGIQRQGGFWRGEYHDLRYFGLLRDDHPEDTKDRR